MNPKIEIKYSSLNIFSNDHFPVYPHLSYRRTETELPAHKFTAKSSGTLPNLFKEEM